jgi:three-Cys-motif partner protein
VPVPDCADCLKLVKHASERPHPPDVAVELRKQTENKLDILSDYYAAWPNTILNGLRRYPQTKPVHLWIIDLFAGRGWHESKRWPEGRRPGTAAAAGFRLWQTLSGRWPFDVYAHIVAVDSDASFEAPLHAALDRFQHPRLDLRVIPMNCADVIDGLRRESLGGYTLWLFDPYGLESIPFCMLRTLFGDKKTELIVNLDAGDAQRVIDAAVQKAGTHDLSAVRSPTLDCLFGGDDWREIPKNLTSTPSRERWLAERYRDLFPASMLRQALPMESSTGFTRFLVQAATHRTANQRFRKSYDEVMKLWKRPREGKVEDMARFLARELPAQEVSPMLVQSLGLFPGASLERIRGACQQALALGLASRCDPDGTVALLPKDEQPRAPKGFFE